MVEAIKLPNQKIKASRINPKRFVLYSKYKAGKTVALANLENNLILDLEKGADYVDALKVNINNLEDLKEVGRQIKEANNPYKYVSIDTVTILEDMVLPYALKLYQKTPMGKNYNDDVLKLPNGAGYLYLREAFFSILSYIDTFAEHIILVGHIKDKQVDDNGKIVEAASIDLKGKIRSLICSQSDAVGYLYRIDKKTFVTFKSNDEITCGARPDHLKNQEILLAEEVDGVYKTYWEKIYK